MRGECLGITVEFVEVEAVRPVDVLCDIKVQTSRFVAAARCCVLRYCSKELLAAVWDNIE